MGKAIVTNVINIAAQTVGVVEDLSDQTALLPFQKRVAKLLEHLFPVPGQAEERERLLRNQHPAVGQRGGLVGVVLSSRSETDVVALDPVLAKPVDNRLILHPVLSIRGRDVHVGKGFPDVVRERSQHRRQDPASLVLVKLLGRGGTVEDRRLRIVGRVVGHFEAVREQAAVTLVMVILGSRRQVHDACEIGNDRQKEILGFLFGKRRGVAEVPDELAIGPKQIVNRQRLHRVRRGRPRCVDLVRLCLGRYFAELRTRIVQDLNRFLFPKRKLAKQPA